MSYGKKEKKIRGQNIKYSKSLVFVLMIKKTYTLHNIENSKEQIMEDCLFFNEIKHGGK